MKVRCAVPFRDAICKVDREAGDEWFVSADRFNKLHGGGYVEAVEPPTVEEIAAAVSAAVVEAITPLIAVGEESGE